MNLSDMVALLPEDQKIRLYLVSYLGVIEAPDPKDETKKYTVTFHYPELIQSQSIDIARQMACAHAEELWPKEKGWISRSITIDPVNPDLIKVVAHLQV